MGGKGRGREQGQELKGQRERERERTLVPRTYSLLGGRRELYIDLAGKSGACSSTGGYDILRWVEVC